MPSVGGAFVCCGVRTDALSLAQAVSAIVERPPSDRAAAVHLCNAYTLSLARSRPDLAATLNRGDLNLADGMPLVWIGRLLGFGHMAGRVYGPDLMLAVCRAGRERGLRHYLYGSGPGTVALLADRLREAAPGLAIVGVDSPPFRPLDAGEEQDLVARIKASRADVVWVGLGTPGQDEFVDRFRDRLDATLVAVGAAFDFHAGVKRQAPRWLRDHGLEWAFRLATEPRRLWRRYLLGNSSFLFGVARDGCHVA